MESLCTEIAGGKTNDRKFIHSIRFEQIRYIIVDWTI